MYTKFHMSSTHLTVLDLHGPNKLSQDSVISTIWQTAGHGHLAPICTLRGLPLTFPDHLAQFALNFYDDLQLLWSCISLFTFHPGIWPWTLPLLFQALLPSIAIAPFHHVSSNHPTTLNSERFPCGNDWSCRISRTWAAAMEPGHGK